MKWIAAHKVMVMVGLVLVGGVAWYLHKKNSGAAAPANSMSPDYGGVAVSPYSDSAAPQFSFDLGSLLGGGSNSTAPPGSSSPPPAKTPGGGPPGHKPIDIPPGWPTGGFQPPPPGGWQPLPETPLSTFTGYSGGGFSAVETAFNGVGVQPQVALPVFHTSGTRMYAE